MTPLHLDQFDELIADGYVGKKFSPCGKYILLCYLKKTFIEWNWNELTVRARGAVFEAYSGKQITQPIPKIFNYTEHYEGLDTAEFAKQEVEMMYKANGHLFLVHKLDADTLVCTTKGSFEMEFIEPDKELLGQQRLDKLNSIMEVGDCVGFEIIAEHDKHTMYENDKKFFGGEDGAVLLFNIRARNDEFEYANMEQVVELAEHIDVHHSHIQTLDGMHSDSVNNMYNVKDTEGVVLYLKGSELHTNSFVKIKTKNYLMERARHYNKAGSKWKKIFRHCVKGSNNYKEHVDEEFWPLFEHVYDSFVKTARRIKHKVKKFKSHNGITHKFDVLDYNWNNFNEYSSVFESENESDDYKYFHDEQVNIYKMALLRYFNYGEDGMNLHLSIPIAELFLKTKDFDELIRETYSKYMFTNK